MALRIRFQYRQGASLGVSLERLADGLLFDFATTGPTVGTFTATPASMVAPLTADSGNLAGRYKSTISPTPVAQFADGGYCVMVHDMNNANAVVALIGASMAGGDDAPIAGGGSAVDPWSVALPGGYAAGTAGNLVGVNLDARVSSRSTYAGGAVAGVTAPVTVGTNYDKAGYALAPAGLDAVAVEPGVNVRQALSPILAATAGALSGAGSGTVVLKGGNSSTTRITATTDAVGNRTSVTLALPS